MHTNRIMQYMAAMVFLLSGTFVKGEILTGEIRLACEALLCLSSGDRPQECQPALSRYFGIHHKKWQDTVNARRQFLRLCPTTSSTGMSSLIESIVSNTHR